MDYVVLRLLIRVLLFAIALVVYSVYVKKEKVDFFNIFDKEAMKK